MTLCLCMEGLGDASDKSFSSLAVCMKLLQTHSCISAMAVDKLLALLVLLQCSAALMGAAVRSSIIGGGDAPKGRWPGLVYLDITTDSGKRKWHCSGSILNQKWVMTAGRCWDDELRTRWDRTGVWVGTYELDKPSERYMDVDFVYRNPEFRVTVNGFISDISLIKLKYPLEFTKTVAPVILPSEDDTFDSSSECWIAGWWRKNNTWGEKSMTLQEMKVRIVSQTRCKAAFPDLSDNMLCAGGPAGGKYSCNCVIFQHPPGDHGSPLMCRTARGFVQVGIMSFRSPDDCRTPVRFGIYTQVSSFMTFIKTFTFFG
ncbi:PREDICTED: tryptase-2-like isoform X2 [Poecilia mexicana]|uniref:tryptase-2-like isoform X2 n=1 Tax=Poecilia mexicana TaxID=48701 RepID=UPI00072DE9B9|nr:PREDICTED: tryptase-2-like isoform X2 [Poecilia mexicana]